MELYRKRESNIKKNIIILNKSNKAKESSFSFIKKEKPKINKYSNIIPKLSYEIRKKHKIENTKNVESYKKYNYRFNSTKINKSNLFLKRKGVYRQVEITDSNRNKINDNNKTEFENQSKTIRKIVTENKNKLLIDNINRKEKYNITEVNNNNKMNNLNYKKNHTYKLIWIKNKKESLNNNNYKQKLHFIKKQKQEYKGFESFLKTDLIKDIRSQNLVDKDKNELLKHKIKFNNNFSMVYSKFNKNIRHAQAKSLNYNNNHSDLQKSLQKYFSLTKKDLEDKIPSKEINLKKNKNIFYNKIKLKENDSKNFNLIDKQIKKINYKKINKGKDKITRFKKKYIQLTFDNNNLIKSSDLYRNYIKKIGFEKEKKLLDIKNNNCSENKINHKKTISTNPNYINYKSLFFKHSSKSKSLNIVYNLEDYIGPNQYENMIIPNHRRTIYQRLFSEKEKEKKELKKIFNTEGIKNSTEYYDKLKNRSNKTSDELYNKKDLDKLVLSGEKKSKNYKIRNLLYNSVFNTNKLKFKKSK